MSILGELHEGTFRGAPFLVTNANTKAGRKTATHEFVNSDNRNTEDLGRLLKTFTVTGVITSTIIPPFTVSPPAPDYFIKRDRLISALERGGKGVLQHPFFGRVEVVAKPYTLTEDLKSLGEAVFVMEFERANDVVLPQPEVSGTPQVVDSATRALGECTADVADIFNSASAESFIKSEILLGEVSETFKSVIKKLVGTPESIATLNSLIEGFDSRLVELISLPLELSEEILGLVTAVDTTLQIALTDPLSVFGGLTQTRSAVGELRQTLSIFGDLFDFNRGSSNIGRATDIGSTGNTISTVEAEIIRNEQVVTRQMGMAALTFAYTDVAITEFNNVDELEAAQDVLEVEFQFLYDDPTIPSDTLLSLQELRDEANKFFEQQKLTINDITSINIKRMPSQVLTYALYGSLDLAQEIVDLNNNPDVSFYDGTVLALTE